MLEDRPLDDGADDAGSVDLGAYHIQVDARPLRSVQGYREMHARHPELDSHPYRLAALLLREMYAIPEGKVYRSWESGLGVYLSDDQASRLASDPLVLFIERVPSERFARVDRATPETRIDGKYMVATSAGVDPVDVANRLEVHVTKVYPELHLDWFPCELTDEQLQRVREDRDVMFVAEAAWISLHSSPIELDHSAS